MALLDSLKRLSDKRKKQEEQALSSAERIKRQVEAAKRAAAEGKTPEE